VSYVASAKVTCVDEPSEDDAARRAAEVLAERTGEPGHDIAVVLGSGWAPAADVIGEPGTEMQLAELPGFLTPAVAGQGHTARSVRVGGNRVLVLLGRTHLYERYGVDMVVHGVRAAAAAGCRTVVLTNAAGGLRPNMRVGQPVMISDHLNMTATSPLSGTEFVDLTDAYSPRLRALARSIDPELAEGVYAGVPGPHFETPAEIRMLSRLGADLVGMSTVLETIAARAAGAEVFGLSLVTNLAAGLSGEPLTESEVLAAGAAAAERMGVLLRDLLASDSGL
jgi:purine-nucleoside phosphorylase